MTWTMASWRPWSEIWAPDLTMSSELRNLGHDLHVRQMKWFFRLEWMPHVFVIMAHRTQGPTSIALSISWLISPGCTRDHRSYGHKFVILNWFPKWPKPRQFVWTVHVSIKTGSRLATATTNQANHCVYRRLWHISTKCTTISLIQSFPPASIFVRSTSFNFGIWHINVRPQFPQPGAMFSWHIDSNFADTCSQGSSWQ